MLKLSLSNGKPILIGAAHIQALIGSGSGEGSTIILGGGVTYEVSQQPVEINRMIEELNTKKSNPPTARPVAAQKPALAATKPASGSEPAVASKPASAKSTAAAKSAAK